jgi:oxygen-independent coproporphyrinogen-3 oxidase
VSDPLGIYVHVPFCSSRCGYCDFNTYTAAELGDGVTQATFHQSLIAELKLAATTLGPRAVTTVFFGGGTPTLIGPDALNQILMAIGDEFDLEAGAEVTCEANPDSVDARVLEQLRSGGFTRMSFGMQSASGNVLRILDRTHTPGASVQAARAARVAGFDHVNLDLIYGTPGETDADLEESLNQVLDAGVDHVSAYSLIVEPGTPLARRVKAGDIPAPDDDVAADRYVRIDERLTQVGLDWYEVSNWSIPGGECRHNQTYWSGADWWGIGPGAHSHVHGVRWWNHKHPRTYATAVEAGEQPLAGREELTADDRRTEHVMLALRTREGLLAADLDGPQVRVVAELLAEGLLAKGAWLDGGPAGRAVLTLKGRLLADAAVRALLADEVGADEVQAASA